MNAKFDALEKLKENNWQEEEKKRKKVVRKIKAKVSCISDCISTEIATVGDSGGLLTESLDMLR